MNIQQLTVNLAFVLKNINDFIFLKREKKLAKLLSEKSITLSTAESCTGGLLSSRLTDVSGSSSYINQNFVTYANKAKIELLGVSNKTIEQYGVVSEETALEMARGLQEKYTCDIAISTTGIAGPTGGSDKKPVGLVCMAIVNGKTEKIYRYESNPLYFRRIMKYDFSNIALDNLIEYLEQNY